MLDRRAFLSVCTQLGFASTLLPGALYAVAAQSQEKTGKPELPRITPEMIDAAAALVGISIAPEQKQAMLAGLNEQRSAYAELRALQMPNSVPPAYVFNPLPPHAAVVPPPPGTDIRKARSLSPAPATAGAPRDESALAFLSVRELGEMVRTKNISSVALTEMYLRRLKRFDPVLHCVITLTEERAMKQAHEADAEIASGKYRGPLHGIPWGAKDLLAVAGYRTTWGAGGYEQQRFDYDAEVVKRLDAAGAILIAKLTMGALAMGDKWFGGQTRNPWNTQQGSSGSSAGSASATAAGLVAFAIGTETLGSISSPSTRCGTTGLRPTFGFVPRTGAMALTWTMDKIGPICRRVEDCALVMQAIYGPDGEDRSVQDAWFQWDAAFDWKRLRVGYLNAAFELAEEPQPEKQSDALTEEEKKKREAARASRALAQVRRQYDLRYERHALNTIKHLGITLVPVALPKFPVGAMTPLLEAEAAAAFDELTQSGRDKLLTEQTPDDWPNLFRIARFYPAVEYIQANRARSLLIREMAKVFDQVDIIVTPSSGQQLVATNLTGHPAVIMPIALRGNDAPTPPKLDDGEDDNIGGPGTPISITFLGPLYQDAKLCAFARGYEQAKAFHAHPPQFTVGT
jgi:Asp-tRNA(Asn)/Glu-tRNA(Gln) amidotransferase A subunit family amidase